MSHGNSPSEEDDVSLSPTGAWNDRPALHDRLDWDNYITALYEFITHRETQPPLTISIDGKWGVGKSSFMLQLEYKLRKKGHFTVRFNPWLHQGSDPLWGAFMRSFLMQLTADLSFRDRLRGRRRLYWAGLTSDLPRLARPLANIVATVLILMVLMGAAALYGPEVAFEFLRAMGWDGQEPTGLAAIGVGGLGSLLTGVTWLSVVWTWSGRNVVDPIRSELQRYLVAPRYEDHISFVEHFHEDLTMALDAYIGEKRRVYVFIDDLDRCDIPQAASLMESINLLLSDDPRLVFLIGMDREKVSAGIAAKYGEIVEILHADYGDPEHDSHVEFGEDFIDKFVQVPFAIPRPTAFENLGTQPNTKQVRELLKSERPDSPRGPPPDLEATDLEADLEVDADRLEKIFERAEQALDYNPRRFKKFVNMLRLYTLVAKKNYLLAGVTVLDSIHGPPYYPAKRSLESAAGNRAKLHEVEADGVLAHRENPDNVTLTKHDPPGQKVTVDQIGKFVIIRLRWKRLVDMMYGDEALLAKLTLVALRRRYWTAIYDELERRAGSDDSVIDQESLLTEREWAEVNERLNGLEMTALAQEQDSARYRTFLHSRIDLDSPLLVIRNGVVPRRAKPLGTDERQRVDQRAELDRLVPNGGDTTESKTQPTPDSPDQDFARRLIDFIGESRFVTHPPSPDRPYEVYAAFNRGHGVEAVADEIHRAFTNILDRRKPFERATGLNSDASLLSVDSKTLLRIAEVDDHSERAPIELADGLFNQGYLAHEAGEYELARATYGEALNYFRELGDSQGESLTLYNIGVTWEAEQNLRAALDCYEDATIAAIWGDLHEERVNGLMAQGNIHYRLGHYHRSLERFTDGLHHAQQYDLLAAEMNCLAGLGDSYEKLGEFEKARYRYEQAHAIASAIGDVEKAIESLGWLGEVDQRLEQDDAALERYEEAYHLARTHGYQQGAVDSLRKQGDLHLEHERFEEALDEYTRARTLAEAHDFHQSVVSILLIEGDVYEKADDPNAASKRYTEAASVARKHENWVGLANSLYWQGVLCLKREKYDDALQRFTEAFGVASDHDHHTGMVNALIMKGDVHEKRDNLDKALDYYEQAYWMALIYDLNDIVANTLNWQAATHETREEYADALADYEAAAGFAREHGDQSAEAIATFGLGYVNLELDEFEVAREHFETALDGFETAGDDHNRVITILDLGVTAFEMGEYDEARALYERALKLLDDSPTSEGMEETLAETRRAMGYLSFDTGDVDAATTHFQDALELFETVGNASRIAELHTLRGRVAFEHGDSQMARECFVESLLVNWDDVSSRPSLVPAGRQLYCTREKLETAVDDRAHERIRDCFREVFSTTTETRFVTDHAEILSVIARLSWVDGDLNRATSLLTASLDLYREAGRRSLQANILEALGDLAVHRGELEIARRHYDDCRQLNRNIGRRGKEIAVLTELIDIANGLADDAAVENYTEERDALMAPVD